MLLNYSNPGTICKTNNISKLKELHKDNNIFEYYNCPCGAKNDKIISKKDAQGLEYNTVICVECGLVRINPYYTEDFIKILYSQFYRDISVINEEIFNNTKEYRGKYIIERIKKSIDINLDKKIVFEVGCGNAGILAAFKEEGAYVYGCEYDNNCIEYAKKKEITVFEGDYSTLTDIGQCDILILSHVLEHIKDPLKFLNNIYSLIDKNGYLYIEVPILEHSEYYYNGDILLMLEPAHVYYFTEFTLLNIMKKTNFKLVDTYTNYKNRAGAGFIFTKSINYKNINYNMEYFYTKLLIKSIINNRKEDHSASIIHKIDNLAYEINNLSYKFNMLLDKIAWWIPIKKWRDSFREKILYKK